MGGCFGSFHLAKPEKMWYTCDNLNRVNKRTVKNLSDVVLSEENYSYDAAGNMTAAPDSTFSYDTNNRLTWYNGDAVSYDADGNMVAAVLQCDCPTYFEYDSANRLLSACGHTYTYNAEDVRIRNLCATEDTKYTYNTNCRLSKLLWKDTNGTVTKYVYGRGLIGEETGNAFKTYHFDCRGSTVALTNASGVITDTFEYDTYGKLISRTGTTAIIFGYNGRDGVVTDANGLIYMRARYYSPDMRRFINADIVAGAISEAVTLNRFAYANGNPVSFIDPFGLSAENRDSNSIITTDGFVGHCKKAILVTDFSLPVVGHSELYFLDEEGHWYRAEFNLYGDHSNLLEAAKDKKQAYVTWKQIDKHPLEQDFPSGFYAVELTGNFDKSVQLARYFAEIPNQFFNGYNLFVNNCADYTDVLLDVADIDGMFSQILIGEDDFISIPIVRSAKTALAKGADKAVPLVGYSMKVAGNVVSKQDFIGSEKIGNVLNCVGEGIINGADFVGDVGGACLAGMNRMKQPRKNVAAYIIKTISDAIAPLWDWLVGYK